MGSNPIRATENLICFSLLLYDTMMSFSQLSLEILKTYGLKIFWILIIFFLGRWSMKHLVVKIAKVNREHFKKHLRGTSLRRSKTIENVVNLASKIVLYSIVFLMILDLFGVKIGPLLAGAGIAGLAIGLGAQRLLQNLFAGLFILIDDQFDIGDLVKINNIQGRVIKLSIHSTVLQGDDNRLIYIPNGLIKEVTNFSQGKSKKIQKKDDSIKKSSKNRSSH